MSTTKVTEKRILQELRQLEPVRWFEVLDFISYLKHHAMPAANSAQIGSRELTPRDLLQSELVGLWADWQDISDSLSFARQLRQQVEHRWDMTDATA